MESQWKANEKPMKSQLEANEKPMRSQWKANEKPMESQWKANEKPMEKSIESQFATAYSESHGDKKTDVSSRSDVGVPAWCVWHQGGLRLTGVWRSVMRS